MTVRDFLLPDLGEGLEEGEIVEWHVEVGETVELNQMVADIETAKAIVSVPSPFEGTVTERFGDVGESLAVGAVFLRVSVGADETAEAEQDKTQSADVAPTEADGAPKPLVGYGAAASRRRRRRAGQTGADPAAPTQPAAEAGSETSVSQGPTTAGASGRALAKPPVRKLARDLGVDLATVVPTGPDGTISRADVHAAAKPEADARVGKPTAQTPSTRSNGSRAGGAFLSGEKAVPGFRGRYPGEIEPIRGIRKRIADKMTQSRYEIPEATCSRDADLTDLWNLRHDLTDRARQDGFDVKITPFVLVMRATIVALRRFPTLNARVEREHEQDPGQIHLLEHINLGCAVDTDRGLVVPTIKNAHTKSTVELAHDLTELAALAREGRIGPDDMTGGTFTVNNYGVFGVDDGDPIINYPESALLGVGAIRERPWVVDGELTVRRVARLTLSFDHRICDGGEAGRFVTYVAQLCEQPSQLLLHV